MVGSACCSIGSSVATNSNVTGISAISSADAIVAPKPKAGSPTVTSAFSVVPGPSPRMSVTDRGIVCTP